MARKGTSSETDAVAETVTMCEVIAQLPVIGRAGEPVGDHVKELIGLLQDMPSPQVVHMVRKCPDEHLAEFVRNLPDDVITALIKRFAALMRA